MAVKVLSIGVSSASKADSKSTATGTIQNTILLSLPRTESIAVLSKLELVRLPARSVLTETGKPIEFAYFLNSGVASIIAVMSDGKSVEVGLTGKEGFIGLPLIIGFSASPTRAVIQIEGGGFKLSVRDLKSLLRNCPKFDKSLQRYSQEWGIQAIQIAACNRLHDVGQRLARWLLMSQDRVGKSTFPLTQEFISHMLGTRRASVTVAARGLQKAGLITYRRGQVTIENRTGLERASCECYRGINQHLGRWRKEVI